MQTLASSRIRYSNHGMLHEKKYPELQSGEMRAGLLAKLIGYFLPSTHFTFLNIDLIRYKEDEETCIMFSMRRII